MGLSYRQTASWRVKDSDVLGHELLLQGRFRVWGRHQVRPIQQLRSSSY